MNSSTDAAPDGLRERKKRARKRELQQATVELALSKGFANVTVEDICERCEVSPRTFFNYFSSKEEAVIGHNESIFDAEDNPAIEDFEQGRPTGSLLGDFCTLLTVVVDNREASHEDLRRHERLLHEDPALLKAQLARMGENERLFRELVHRRLEHDGVPPALIDHRAQVLAALAVATFKVTFHRMRSEGAEATDVIPAVFDELEQLFTKEGA